MEVDIRESLLTELLFSQGLETLEGMLGGFNIFEAIGAVNRELRHSDFLSFLLEPTGAHGLNGRFLKDFLVGYFADCSMPHCPSLIDVGCFSYESFTVYREWKRIDLLLVSNLHKIVIAVENKIWSCEHSDQLSRYQETVEKNYQGYRLFYVYLTPAGLETENNDDWQPMSYKGLSERIRKTFNRSRGSMSESVAFAVEQYLEMLERHILDDSEISRLCQKIYAQHRQALDLIFEHRPDQVAALSEFLQQQVKEREIEYGLRLDHCTKGYVRFSTQAWDEQPNQLRGSGEWTSSNRLVLFELINRGDYIRLVIVIGPGAAPLRNAIFEKAESHRQLFSGNGRKSLSPKYHRLYSKNILPKGLFTSDDDPESIQLYLTEQLEHFFQNEFGALVESILEGLRTVD